jgi:hypothetical protein
MSEIVSKAKRIISRIATVDELIELQKYIREREQILNKRARDAKAQSKWEKIAALEVGARVVINVAGDGLWPRGTELEFLGSKRTRISLSHDGKTYLLNKNAVAWWDVKPLPEFNPDDKAYPQLLGHKSAL